MLHKSVTRALLRLMFKKPTNASLHAFASTWRTWSFKVCAAIPSSFARKRLHPLIRGKRRVCVPVFRASGAGGQHVNTTNSAVRAIHHPSGIRVSVSQVELSDANRAGKAHYLSFLFKQSQSDRSQHRNKANALQQLQVLLQERADVEAAQTKVQRRAGASMNAFGTRDQVRSYSGFPL